MILSRRAERQIDALRVYYQQKNRPEATRSLAASLVEAARKIDSNPEAGLVTPRPYPDLARPGRLWIKAGRYWIAYRPSQPPVLLAVFFEAADIPGRA